VDIVLDEQHAIDLDVDGKPAQVEDGAHFLVELCKDVVCVLLNRLVAVSLAH